MHTGTYFTDPERMESWVNFSGYKGRRAENLRIGRQICYHYATLPIPPRLVNFQNHTANYQIAPRTFRTTPQTTKSHRQLSESHRERSKSSTANFQNHTANYQIAPPTFRITPWTFKIAPRTFNSLPPPPAPCATLRLLSCSQNFPRASIIRYTHAKHEPITKYTL